MATGDFLAVNSEEGIQTEVNSLDRLDMILACNETISQDSEPGSPDSLDACCGDGGKEAVYGEKQTSEAPKLHTDKANTNLSRLHMISKQISKTARDSTPNCSDGIKETAETIEAKGMPDRTLHGVESTKDTDSDVQTLKVHKAQVKRRGCRGHWSVVLTDIAKPRRSQRAAANQATTNIKDLLGEEDIREVTDSVSDTKSSSEDVQDIASEDDSMTTGAPSVESHDSEEAAPVLDSETGIIRTPSGTLLEPPGDDAPPASPGDTTTAATTATVSTSSQASAVVNSTSSQPSPVITTSGSGTPSSTLLCNRVGKCMVCENMRLVKYMLMVNGSSAVYSLVCSEHCLTTLKQGRTRTGVLPHSIPMNTPMTVLAVPPLQVNTASNSTQLPVRCSVPTPPVSVEMVLGGSNLCASCKKPVLTNNTQRVVWETNLFCSVACTIQYQKRDGANCVFCGSHLVDTALGKYCVRFGGDVRQFCSTLCLDGFKKQLKVCSYCQRDITHFAGSFLAPVGDSTAQFKEFCSQSCLTRYKSAQTNSKPPTVEARCSVCSIIKPVVHRVVVKPGEVPKQLCSEPCLNACKFAFNEEEIERCAMCENLMVVNNLECFGVWQHCFRTRLCSQSCSNVFVLTNRRIVTCRHCKVKKYNFDMMDVLGEKDGVFCSVHCLTNTLPSGTKSTAAAGSSPAPATSGIGDKPASVLTCQECKSLISRSSLLSNTANHAVFCSRACVDTYNQKKGLVSAVPMVPSKAPQPMTVLQLSTAPTSLGTSAAVTANTGTSSDKSSSQLPTIQSVMSLAAGKSKRPTARKSDSSPELLPQALAHPSVVVVPPPPPPAQRNVSVQARPRTREDPPLWASGTDQSTQTGGLPNGVERETQTGIDLETTRAVEALVAMGATPPDRHMSTDTDDIPATVAVPAVEDPDIVELPQPGPAVKDPDIMELPPTDTAEVCALPPEPKKVYMPIPVPVPFYVPVPLAMYSCPYPVPLPLVLPIPVPLPLPGLPALTNGAGRPAKRPHQDSESSGCAARDVAGSPDSADELSDGPPAYKRTKGEESGAIDLAALLSAPATPMRASQGDAEQHRQTTSVKVTWCCRVYEQFVRSRRDHCPAEEEARLQQDLQLVTPVQLCRGLTLLITELTRPGGQPYPPDLIHYILLGVQLQLAAGGRREHLFSDEPYRPALEALRQRLQPLVHSVHHAVGDRLTHELCTHVEERHLWQAKVLGAHTPLSLLTTVLYFSVKYFCLVRVEQLQKMCFSMLSFDRGKRTGGMTPCLRLLDSSNLLGCKKRPIIWENSDDPFKCPVKFFQFYISHCPPVVMSRERELPLLLEMERQCRPEAAVWFTAEALPPPRLEELLARVLSVREVQTALLSDAMLNRIDNGAD